MRIFLNVVLFVLLLGLPAQAADSIAAASYVQDWIRKYKNVTLVDPGNGLASLGYLYSAINKANEELNGRATTYVAEDARKTSLVAVNFANSELTGKIKFCRPGTYLPSDSNDCADCGLGHYCAGGSHRAQCGECSLACQGNSAAIDPDGTNGKICDSAFLGFDGTTYLINPKSGCDKAHGNLEFSFVGSDGSYTVSASSRTDDYASGKGYSPQFAFCRSASASNGASSDGWFPDNSDTAPWLQIQLPVCKTATRTRFATRPMSDDLLLERKTFEILGSNDGTSWTVLYKRETGTTRPGGKHAFTDWINFTTTGCFLYYRMQVITAIDNTFGNGGLGEWELAW
jgi:hypothetical protein